jgi:hypothetical protein
MARLSDSSLTRVRPAFDVLGHRTDGWREELCSLGSRSDTLDVRPGDWAGAYTSAPQFEDECRAPTDLRFLLEHADEADLIANENLKEKRYEPETRRKREVLFGGDLEVRAEALRRLVEPDGTRPGRGQWHVLEGVDQGRLCVALRAAHRVRRGEADGARPHRQDRVVSVPEPTSNDNILLSGERYGLSRYGLDITLMWPRLFWLLSEEVQRSIDVFKEDHRLPLALSFASADETHEPEDTTRTRSAVPPSLADVAGRPAALVA